MLKQSFRDYIFSTNTDGGDKVASYVRALDMLGTILKWHYPHAWAEDEANSLNLENGLCLSATYDAAFDRHLISFDENYRLIVSKAIKDHYTDAAAKSYLSFKCNGEIFKLANFSFIDRFTACVFNERKEHAYAVA